jgi:hypothetical protein
MGTTRTGIELPRRFSVRSPPPPTTVVGQRRGAVG